MEDEELDNIWVAISNGDAERIGYLLNVEGVSVNAQDERGYAPLHAASSYGEIETLKMLVARGADVNIRDYDGDTPLLYAELPAVFDLLVSYGADPLARNNENEGIQEKVIDDENEVLFNHLVEKNIITDQKIIERMRKKFSEEEGEVEDLEGYDYGDSYEQMGMIEEDDDAEDMN